MAVEVCNNKDAVNFVNLCNCALENLDKVQQMTKSGRRIVNDFCIAFGYWTPEQAV